MYKKPFALMGKPLLRLDYKLIILLTGVACAFEVQQPFAIYMDVRKTLDDSVQIGKSCERKMSIMDSILEIRGKKPANNLQAYSFEEFENLERRVNACGLKLNAMETMAQSFISRSKETTDELREHISKVLSTVADLASKFKRR